jgi:hypothetical protein
MSFKAPIYTLYHRMRNSAKNPMTNELSARVAGLPEDLRRYVQVDVEGIAEEWGQYLHVADADGGKVWVYDARC